MGMAKELAGENVGEAVGLMEMLGIAGSCRWARTA
jgi:hypothetical protein